MALLGRAQGKQKRVVSFTSVIRRFQGDLSATRGTVANSLWPCTGWWIEWPEFVTAMGREPRDLDEYVEWS